MRPINFIIAVLAAAAFAGCNSSADSDLKPGIWRAVLSRDGQELPLLLDISKNTDGKTYAVYSLNGKERLALDSAYFENDSLHIPMALFESEIV
jgi:hypothetical protein